MSNSFPSPSGEDPLTYQPPAYETEQDIKTMEEVIAASKKCNSLCCTGAFVAETMLCVILNEDIKRLDFGLGRRNNSTLSRGGGGNSGAVEDPHWHSSKLLKKYVSFQLPAVLAHYGRGLAQSCAIKTTKLESLTVKHTGIHSRSFAFRRAHFDVLTAYPELVPYLEVPDALCTDAAGVPGEGAPERFGGGHLYGAFSEHLVRMLLT